MEETTESGSIQPPIKKEDKANTRETLDISPKSISKENVAEKPVKPPKPEDKPFLEFIQNDFIPALNRSLTEKGVEPCELIIENGEMPVIGIKCWQVKCSFNDSRRFWLCFQTDKISSLKTFILAETGSEPSLLESFLIDEKKTTLALLVSRILQRLNGQKWLGPN